LAGGSVVPDGGGQGQKALRDADSNAVDGASAVLFQVERAFEGVVDRLDELADGLEQRFTRVGRAVAVGRPDQPDAALGEELVELAGDVALVRDDQQAGF
jgi:hypothetical protein